MKALGIEPGAAEIAMLPQNYVKLEGKPAQQMVKLMEAARGARRHARRSGRTPTSKRRRSRPRWREDLRDRSRLRAHRVRLHRVRRQPSPPRHLRVPERPRPRDIPRQAEASSTPVCRRCCAGIGPTASPSRTSSTRATCAARLKLGHARGVALLAAVEAGLPIVEYAPAEIKRAVVGYGRAEKHAGAADGQAAARARRSAVAARRRRRAGRRDLPRAQRHGRHRRARSSRTRSHRPAQLAGLSSVKRPTVFCASPRHDRPSPRHARRQGPEPHRRRRRRRRLRRAGAAVDVLSSWRSRARRSTLRVHTHVREDAIALYGFATPLEHDLFERLIAINGVGPKLALAVLSGHRARGVDPRGARARTWRG